jgi:hypothetical protein
VAAWPLSSSKKVTACFRRNLISYSDGNEGYHQLGSKGLQHQSRS